MGKSYSPKRIKPLILIATVIYFGYCLGDCPKIRSSSRSPLRVLPKFRHRSMGQKCPRDQQGALLFSRGSLGLCFVWSLDLLSLYTLCRCPAHMDGVVIGHISISCCCVTVAWPHSGTAQSLARQQTTSLMLAKTDHSPSHPSVWVHCGEVCCSQVPDEEASGAVITASAALMNFVGTPVCCCSGLHADTDVASMDVPAPSQVTGGQASGAPLRATPDLGPLAGARAPMGPHYRLYLSSGACAGWVPAMGSLIGPLPLPSPTVELPTAAATLRCAYPPPCLSWTL